MQSAGDYQTLDDAGVLGAEFGPAEYPRLSAHWNHAKRTLDVGIDGNIWVGEEQLEADASFAHIVQSLDEWVAWGEALTHELLIDPRYLE